MLSTKQKQFTVHTAERQIDLVQWVWGPIQAFGNIPTIGKAFAVPLAHLSQTDEHGNPNISEALMLLFAQMEENDIWKLLTLIVDGVKYENRDINLEEDLDGDLNAILEVAAMALTNNYESLFSGKGLGSLFDKMVGMTQLSQVK